MSMRAMILSAGRGKRMQELTSNTPKPLLKIYNKTLIEYNIESLAKAGIKNIVINIYYLGEQIQKFLGNGDRFGVKINYSIEKQLLDTGGGIVNALLYLGSEPFLVLSADIHTDFDYNEILNNKALDRIRNKKLKDLAHVIMVDNPNYHPQGDFSIKENGLLISKDKKNKFNKNLTYGNIGLFDPEFFYNAPIGAFPLRLLLDRAITKQQITATHYTGEWHNIGRQEDLANVHLG